MMLALLLVAVILPGAQAKPVLAKTSWIKSYKCIEVYKQADLEEPNGGPEGSIGNPGDLECTLQVIDQPKASYFRVRFTVIGKQGRIPLGDQILLSLADLTPQPVRPADSVAVRLVEPVGSTLLKPLKEIRIPASKDCRDTVQATPDPFLARFLVPRIVVETQAKTQPEPHIAQILFLEIEVIAYDRDGRKIHGETRRIKGSFDWFE